MNYFDRRIAADEFLFLARWAFFLFSYLEVRVFYKAKSNDIVK